MFQNIVYGCWAVSTKVIEKVYKKKKKKLYISKLNDM